VAVIDIHIRRAGIAAGFFVLDWKLPKDYRRFEQALCAVARIGGVSAATLDAVMWRELRRLRPAGLRILGGGPRGRLVAHSATGADYGFRASSVRLPTARAPMSTAPCSNGSVGSTPAVPTMHEARPPANAAKCR